MRFDDYCFVLTLSPILAQAQGKTCFVFESHVLLCTFRNLCVINPVDLEGYSVKCEKPPTASGGVGIYVPDSSNYTVRNDLKLNVNVCEDLWIEIETDYKSNDKPNIKQEKLIIGTILVPNTVYFVIVCVHL